MVVVVQKETGGEGDCAESLLEFLFAAVGCESRGLEENAGLEGRFLSGNVSGFRLGD